MEEEVVVVGHAGVVEEGGGGRVACILEGKLDGARVLGLEACMWRDESDRVETVECLVEL